MTPTIDQLWGALRPTECQEACHDFVVTTDSETKGHVCERLAVLLRFRQKTLLTMPNLRLGSYMAARIKDSYLTRFRDDAIKAWLIERHRPVITRFVTALGVEHEDGLVTTDVEAPSIEQCREAIRAMPGDSKRIVGVYLGYLVTCDDATWENLPAAMEAEGCQISELLVSDEPMQAEAADGEQITQAEDNQAFTTLDNLLIKTAVSSAFGQEGALTHDQLTDLVEEIVELNSGRPRSLFHRGYLHALLGREYAFHFPGENMERRLWYACGVMFGLLRHNRPDVCVKILLEHKDLAKGLASSTQVPCGAMLLKHLFSPLVDVGELPLLTEWMRHQLPKVAKNDGVDLLVNAHYRGAALLRQGNAAEADMLFEVVERFLPVIATVESGEDEEGEPLPDPNSGPLMADNTRKRAQVLQLQGDFASAASLLEKVLADHDYSLKNMAAVLADIGLILGGFRSVAGTLPGPDESHVPAHINALKRGEGRFDEAIQRYGRGATNAHFCKGLLHLLEGKDVQAGMAASSHFSPALSGMLKRQNAYEASGMIDWTRFGLGVSLLESLDLGNFVSASEQVKRALESSVVFPLWLWKRLLVAAGMFPDRTLAEQTAVRLLSLRGESAIEALLASNAADANKELRDAILNYIEGGKLPVKDQWSHLSRMLSGALRDDNAQAEHILDAMERLAVENPEFRLEWCSLMQDSRYFSPAWDSVDAERSLVRFHELMGDFESARHCLRQAFFRHREAGTDFHAQLADALLDQLKTLPCPCADLDELRASLEAITLAEMDKDRVLKELKQGREVRVLYVGGDETQARYVERIRSDLSSSYPGLTVEFDLPGWSSSWNRDLDRSKQKLRSCDVVVLSYLVRTQFGRGLREACGATSPWLPCTGKGKQAIIHSIQRAATFALHRQLDKQS